MPDEPVPTAGSEDVSIDRIVVIGAGAIGGSTGGLLAEAGVPVVLVARGVHGDVLAARGLEVRMPDRTVRVRPPVRPSPGDVDWRDGDLVVLATKTHDALAALGRLRAAAGPSVPVACFTNGLQSEAWARDVFDTVLSTLVWVAASHLDPGIVQLYSRVPRGVLDTGGDRDLGEELSATLRTAGFDATWRPAIRPWKVAKWVTNLGGAAQALVDGDWPAVVAVARREGERVLATVGTERVSMTTLMERVGHVAVDQVDGRVRGGGSTWQSERRGRPLESEWIEGALAALAEEAGIGAPVNRRLATMATTRRRAPATDLLAIASPLDRDVTMR